MQGTYTLKTGEQLIIREATRSDASDMIQYVKQVGDETDFLTFEGSQFNKSEQEEITIIQEHKDRPNQIFLLALIDEELVGMLNVVASPKPRLQHVGEFGVSVLKSHWNKGIASILIKMMISWAEESKIIKKINLKVLQNNKVALQLYKRLGFEIEGLLRRDFFIKDVYYDAYMMGMIVD